MKKTLSYTLILTFTLLALILTTTFSYNEKREIKTLTGTITNIKDNIITITTTDNVEYNIALDSHDLQLENTLILKYQGNLSTSKDFKIISYEQQEKESLVPIAWQDNGLFKDYYEQAYNLLNTLSLDEKIGQLLLARHPSNNDVKDAQTYHLGGYVFFASDFKNKTTEQVKNMISNIQTNTSIPLLTAVDEEGGKVIRVSKYQNLAPTPFLSPSEIYLEGGYEAIREDTINKSKLLSSLGLNLNLAPVVDVSTNKADYIYERTLKLPTNLVNIYAKTVIEASKEGTVSYTLKHFPGYGNSKDTHKGMAINKESLESIQNNYLPPFIFGIEAEAIMVSHNIMENIDSENPSSLSLKIHDILLKDLNFTGIIITDDLSMGAITQISMPNTKAILAGNDLLITTDYAKSFQEIKDSLANNTISEDILNHHVFKILAWKYYKHLI